MHLLGLWMCSPNDFDGFMGDEFAMVEDVVEESVEDVVEVPFPASKKKPRGGNYSVSEDETLVLARENVTLDPVVVKDQPVASYWQHIVDYYHNTITVIRTVRSLNHH